MVTVPAAPVLSNTAVSCANGKLLTSGVPPDEVAHPTLKKFCDPAKFQYTVFGEGKVMPELPPKSPPRVTDVPDAVPERITSSKSQLVDTNVPTVSSAVETPRPIVVEEGAINKREEATDVPTVKVLVTVTGVGKSRYLVPFNEVELHVRFRNVPPLVTVVL